MKCIGLRYFNVNLSRLDPNGAYTAAMSKFTMQLMPSKNPQINGDGTNSRDFTYINNVIQINDLAGLITNTKA
jgi:UDP-N-acetylglucosamine 4-epimerase